MRYYDINLSISTTCLKINSFQIWIIYMAQKMDLIFPFEVLDILAGNSNPRYIEPSYLVQSWFLLRVTNGEKLVWISQTIIEKCKIENFVVSITSPYCIKIVFWIISLSYREGMGRKNVQFWISLKWLRYQHPLLNSRGFFFVLSMKALGALYLDFLPKMSKSFRFGENSFLYY